MASTIKVDNVQNTPGTNIINKCSVTTTIGAGAGDTINVCGATVNIGRCGGTVNLTAGATQSGFGRTGTVDWITTPKVTGDSPITGVTGKGYFLNTTAGTITLNLPAGAAGSIVSLADYAATWQTNNVTVSPNGSEKIGGIAAGVTLNTEGQSVTFVYVDSTQGWLNTMDSTSNVRGAAFIVATGGTPSQCGDYEIRKFTGPGTFNVTAAAICASDNQVDYLIVAGGGSGGGEDANSVAAGGGGAGGFRVSDETYCASGSPAEPLANATGITVSASPYSIVVGGGGAGDAGGGGGGPGGTSGVPSSALGLTSAGGGFGGYTGGPSSSPSPTANPRSGTPGGSGGGASHNMIGQPGGNGNDPPVSPAQGTNGGPSTPSTYLGGGGGGAIAAGTGGGGSPGPGGAGGGLPSGFGVASGQSCGSYYYFSGGGGGGGATAVPVTGAGGGAGLGGGGVGGTGNQNPTDGGAGTANTGGGGGGAGNSMPSGTGNIAGAAGGSGIVILRYKFQ